MDKEKYADLDLEIIEFQCQDIITESQEVDPYKP